VRAAARARPGAHQEGGGARRRPRRPGGWAGPGSGAHIRQARAHRPGLPQVVPVARM